MDAELDMMMLAELYNIDWQGKIRFNPNTETIIICELNASWR